MYAYLLCGKILLSGMLSFRIEKEGLVMISLQRVAPHQVGVDAKAVSTFVTQVEKQLGIHSFMLLRHGKVAAEGFWHPYTKEHTHVLFSMSKTFTSAAIGFAVQEGLLSVTDRVLSFFPKALPAAPCENMQKMEIRHLLNMATGHSEEPDAFAPQESWVYRFLTSYVDCEPGSIWCYNTPATYMLSAIVQQVSGQTLFEFLTPRLFEPLGFTKHWWELSPEGINTGGFGLNVRLEDLAKFGQLYLNHGIWEGKPILDAAWIEETALNRISNAHSEVAHRQSTQGYGYQIWRCTPEHVYRGDGAFGQYCVIMPDQDAVFVANAGENQMHEIIELFFQIVLPSLTEEIEVDEVAEKALAEQCAGLTLKQPEGIRVGVQEQKYSGKRYVFPENELGLTCLSVEFGKPTKLHFVLDEHAVTIPVGYGEWVCSETGIPEIGTSSVGNRVYSHAAAVGAWRANDYTVKIAYYKTPFVDTFRMVFDDKGVILKYERNASFDQRIFEVFGREAE